MTSIKERCDLILGLMKRKLATSIKDNKIRKHLLNDTKSYNYYLNELRNGYNDAISMNRYIDMLNNASSYDILKAAELFNKIKEFLPGYK